MSGSNANDLTATSLLTGFLTGKLGLFGLKKQEVAHDAMNWCSMIFVVASMVVFFLSSPQSTNAKSTRVLMRSPSLVVGYRRNQRSPVSWIEFPPNPGLYTPSSLPF